MTATIAALYSVQSGANSDKDILLQNNQSADLDMNFFYSPILGLGREVGFKFFNIFKRIYRKPTCS